MWGQTYYIGYCDVEGEFGVFVVVVVGCGKILIKSPLERKESLDRVFVTVLY